MWFKTIKTIVAVFLRIFFRISIIGEENIPQEGGCVVCANHASNWDPVFLIALLKRRIYFMSKEELFHVFGLGALLRSIDIIPVKRNASDISAVRTSIKVLNEGKALGIFPSGRRVKKGEEVEVKSGVAFIAVKAAASVIPVYIETSYRIFSRVKIYVGKAEDMSVYGKAKLSAEELGEISNGLFKNINALAEGSK